MALKSFQLALTASALRLSDVYGGTAGVADARTDIPYCQLLITTAAADAFLGESSVTTTAYGAKISATSAPLSLGPFNAGPLRLSDLYAVGTGATLHILGVPY
jgi:hypothetical protein